jgi:hypothetical protein
MDFLGAATRLTCQSVVRERHVHSFYRRAIHMAMHGRSFGGQFGV